MLKSNQQTWRGESHAEECAVAHITEAVLGGVKHACIGLSCRSDVHSAEYLWGIS